MPWREVRDPETGRLIIKYDREDHRIQYLNRDGRLCEQPLARYPQATKAQPVKRPPRIG